MDTYTMDTHTEDLEGLLENSLRREQQRHGPSRYVVEAGPEGLWVVRDRVQDKEQGGRIVRHFKGRSTAQSCALFGNMLGPCVACVRPATVLVYGEERCIDCLPPGERWGLIPLDILRLWRQSEYR